MLKGALRAIVNELFLKSFNGKRKKKKAINILIAFSISHNSGIKIFLKWFINNFPKGIC